jgi:hypothetical protein
MSNLKRVTQYGSREQYAPTTAVDPSKPDPSHSLGVNGGHRAGKRKRGTSVLKRQPKSTVHTYVMPIIETASGDTVAHVRTLSYAPPKPTPRTYRRTTL